MARDGEEVLHSGTVRSAVSRVGITNFEWAMMGEK
jgi:hypothetical protein